MKECADLTQVLVGALITVVAMVVGYWMATRERKP